ncbi:MAG: ATP-binding protein [Roseburia sp.]|nr:ATP-binding protein [Roseburia sp.]
MTNITIENLEYYWDIVNELFRILTLLATAGIYACFLKPFLIQKKSAFITGASYFFSMLILSVIPYNMWGIVAYSIGCMTMLLTMYVTDRRNVRQKLFLAILLLMFKNIVQGIALSVYRVLSYVFLERNPIMSPQKQLASFFLMETAYFILRSLLLYFLAKLAGRVYTDKREDMSCQELILMLLPVSLSVVTYYLESYFVNIYERDLGTTVWFNHGEYDYFEAFYDLLSYGMILAVLIFYRSIKKKQREERENAVLAGQMEDMRNHICEVEKMYDDIRSIRHDMGNHIMILENLYRKNQWGEAEEYAKKLTDTMEESFFHVRSKNPVTDVILEEMWKRAAEKGIGFRCDFYFGTETIIDAFDMSVILNNGLTNAIEGTNGREPFIHIFSSREKNVFLIEIQNSFEGELLWDQRGELPQTTKSREQGHGYGLGNIRKIARKYQGDIAVKAEEGKFILTVMLLLE